MDATCGSYEYTGSYRATVPASSDHSSIFVKHCESNTSNEKVGVNFLIDQSKNPFIVDPRMTPY
jgi:hypothetical protein